LTLFFILPVLLLNRPEKRLPFNALPPDKDIREQAGLADPFFSD
jgi:hypothetical protein